MGRVRSLVGPVRSLVSPVRSLVGLVCSLVGLVCSRIGPVCWIIGPASEKRVVFSKKTMLPRATPVLSRASHGPLPAVAGPARAPLAARRGAREVTAWRSGIR